MWLSTRVKELYLFTLTALLDIANLHSSWNLCSIRYLTQNQPYHYVLYREALNCWKIQTFKSRRKAPSVSLSNTVPYQSNEPHWSLISVFCSAPTPRYTTSLSLCNHFQMLKNTAKDLEKYAGWQTFFSYVCVISLGREGHDSERVAFGCMEEVRQRVNSINVFYMHI